MGDKRGYKTQFLDMNYEQRIELYRILGEQLREYEEELERDRLESIMAARAAHQIFKYGRIISEDYPY